MTIKNGLISYRPQPYGAQIVNNGIVATGGSEAGNDGYKYHVFKESGTLSVKEPVKADIMVIGGGGGGGMDNGGGAGSGEIYISKNYYLPIGDYPIVIGAGGAGAPTSSGSSTGNPGTDGNNSTFGSLFTARGGGGGASGQGTVKSREGGQNGGSGGGGQGENYASYYIYGGLGYGSLEDHQVSYHFTPGLSHYLTVAGNSVFNFGESTDFTISLWINQRNDYTTTPSSGYVFSAGSTYSYALNYTANSWGIKNLTFDINSPSGTLSLNSNFGGLSYQSWAHVAITRSGSTFRMYVNGKKYTEATGTYDVTSNSEDINIGNSFEGIIKDLHIISGAALYTGETYTIPTTYPTVTDNTVLLCLLDPTTEDHSQYSHTITTNSSIRASITSWTSNGGRSMGSPYSFPMTKITYKSGFEWGSGSYIRADGALTPLSSGSDHWTVECYVKAGTLFTADNYIFGINTLASGANVILMGWDRIYDGSTSHFLTEIVRPHIWQHYAVTYDGSTVRGYVDGVLVTSYTDSWGALNTCTFSIGAEFDAADGGNPGNYFYGKMRNMRFVAGTALYTSSSFTPPDINTDLTDISGTTLLLGVDGAHSNGEIQDASAANTTLTIVGTVKPGYNFPVSTEHSSALFTSTYNNYYRADTALSSLTSISSPWTIEAFVQSDTYFMYDDTTDGFLFGMNGSSDGVNVLLLNGVRVVYNNGSADVTQYGFKQPLNQQWTHVAYTYDGSTLRAFYDGIKVFEQTITLLRSLSNCVLGIGAEFDTANGGTPGNYWYGRMRELRVSSECLYTDNFIAPDPINDTLSILPSTTLLTFRDGNTTDESGNNITVTGYNHCDIVDCLGYYYKRYNNYYDERYGNDGGMAGPAGDDGGGGGGGAGREGRRAGSETGGPGGNGIISEFLSPLQYWAGGGGGGNNNSGSSAVIAGGEGGGGNGGVTGTAAAINSGGGGGASKISIAGANGGSGLVVVRYKQSSNEN